MLGIETRGAADKSRAREVFSGLSGKRVLALESRRRDEMRTLIEKQGGAATVAPALREVALEDSVGGKGATLERFARSLLQGKVDYLVCMTGVGTRMLLRELEKRSFEALEALREVHIVVRGSKPLNVLREAGYSATLVEKPHTWREVQSYFAALERTDPKVLALSGKRVSIAEFGEETPLELQDFLCAQGAKVDPLPLYRWGLPEDTEPLEQAILELVKGKFDLLLLTSGIQLWHLMGKAFEMELEGVVRKALESVPIASIGPSCTDSVRELGFQVALESDPCRMGNLVSSAAAWMSSRVGV